MELEDFLHVNGRSLHSFAFLLTLDGRDAEDLMQDVLSRLWRHWPRVEKADNPLAYVRKALVLTNRSRLRRLRVRTTALTSFHDVAEPERASVDAHLESALRSLPPRQRTAVVLRYYLDYSERQAADAMGCSVGAVKSQTHAGLAKLRLLLDSDGRELTDQSQKGQSS